MLILSAKVFKRFLWPKCPHQVVQIYLPRLDVSNRDGIFDIAYAHVQHVFVAVLNLDLAPGCIVKTMLRKPSRFSSSKQIFSFRYSSPYMFWVVFVELALSKPSQHDKRQGLCDEYQARSETPKGHLNRFRSSASLWHTYGLSVRTLGVWAGLRTSRSSEAD